MIAYTVQPGDTLSAIAAAHGDSLSAVEAANPQITNPDLIYAGNTIHLPSGGTATISAPQAAPSSSVPSSSASSPSALPKAPVASASVSSGSSASGDLGDVPGVPHAFASCVAEHESSNGTNQAYNGGVYGIITASGVNVNGQSVAAQKQAFSDLYQKYGTSPWAPYDGC